MITALPHTAAFQPFAVHGAVSARFLFTKSLELSVIGPLGISNFTTPPLGTSDFQTPPLGVSEFTTPDSGETDL